MPGIQLWCVSSQEVYVGNQIPETKPAFCAPKWWALEKIFRDPLKMAMFDKGVSPKIVVFPPNHPFVHRLVHYKASILGGKNHLFLVQHPYPMLVLGGRTPWESIQKWSKNDGFDLRFLRCFQSFCCNTWGYGDYSTAPMKDLDKTMFFEAQQAGKYRFVCNSWCYPARSSSRSIFIPTPPGRMTRQNSSRASCRAAQEITIKVNPLSITPLWLKDPASFWIFLVTSSCVHHQKQENFWLGQKMEKFVLLLRYRTLCFCYGNLRKW